MEKFRNLFKKESAIRLLALYGPSGSGKSSLARAGLIPALAKWPLPGRDQASVAVMVPGIHPLEALATVLARLATNDYTPVAKIREFTSELHMVDTEGNYDGLRRIANSLPEIDIKPLIIMVDQLEEVFTLCENLTERNAFIKNLLYATSEISKHVSAIITLRSDFLGVTQKYPKFNQLISSQGFLVPAMSVEELQEAITKPAELAEHPLDPSTVKLLIEQTEGREGALPLLQFALTRIWSGLINGKEPVDTLGEIGGVGGALACEAQRIYDSLDPEQQEIARRVFLGLVQLGEGTKDTRRRTNLKLVISHRDSLQQVQNVIDYFVHPSARLITLAGNIGEKTAEVTHEALLENWQQLKDWLNDSRSDLLFQRRLDEAATYWSNNGRSEGNLWRSPNLDLLWEYYERAGDEMTSLHLEFFQESERLETKQKLKKLVALGGLIAGLISISVLAFLAINQLKQVKRLQVEQLATNGHALLASNQPVNAVVNIIAAFGLSQSHWVQLFDYPQFASVDGGLLDISRMENPEQNQLIHESGVKAVAISRDGKRIITGSGDGTVRIWDAKTGKLIGQLLQKSELGIFSVAISHDGQRIISGSWDGTVRIWDAKTGKPIGQLLQKSELGIFSVVISHDGRRIISGGMDNTVRIWDANTGKPIGQPLKGHEGTVSAVVISHDGKRIISSSGDETVRIWSTETGKSIGQPLKGHKGVVTSVVISHDGRRIISGSEDGTVRIWSADTGKPIGQPLKSHEGRVTSVVISHDGRRIISGSEDGTVRIWSAETEKPIGQPLMGYKGGIPRAISHNGQYLISDSKDGTVQIWDTESDKPIGQPLKDHEREFLSVAISYDGQRIITGSGDGTVRIWDTNTGKLIGQPLKGHEGTVSAVAISHDGQRIISGGMDKTVRIWDTNTGKLIGQPLKGHEEVVTSVALSPHIISRDHAKDNDQYIVSGSADNTVWIWDANTGKPIGQPLKGHREVVTSVAISHDKQRIISSSGDGTVRIWSTETGKLIGQPLKGHKGKVSAVAISHDGQRIISGGMDKTVRIWDAKTGKLIGQPLKGHEGGVTSVAISHDGKRIISGSWDETVRIWDISQRRLLRRACNRLRYHPILLQPKTFVAKEAMQTCARNIWK
ncbi:hypothetical protein AM10699_67130 (plasmid) [Acaryochloris marina MBIC10699]|nr:hypothetical protein AM10699_67130 [Acaryochloris marina MBIC10699]